MCVCVRMDMCEHPHMGVKALRAIPLKCPLCLDSLSLGVGRVDEAGLPSESGNPPRLFP